jgi:hypothetical protein
VVKGLRSGSQQVGLAWIFSFTFFGLAGRGQCFGWLGQEILGGDYFLTGFTFQFQSRFLGYTATGFCGSLVFGHSSSLNAFGYLAGG